MDEGPRLNALEACSPGRLELDVGNGGPEGFGQLVVMVGAECAGVAGQNVSGQHYHNHNSNGGKDGDQQPSHRGLAFGDDEAIWTSFPGGLSRNFGKLSST